MDKVEMSEDVFLPPHFLRASGDRPSTKIKVRTCSY